MKELAVEIMSTLLRFWKYDMEVFSQPWIYYWLCIPAVGYLTFFFVKWIVITAPIWIPIKMMLPNFVYRKTTKKEKA